LFFLPNLNDFWVSFLIDDWFLETWVVFGN
jgi:hypothetical protein